MKIKAPFKVETHKGIKGEFVRCLLVLHGNFYHHYVLAFAPLKRLVERKKALFLA